MALGGRRIYGVGDAQDIGSIMTTVFPCISIMAEKCSSNVSPIDPLEKLRA